MTVHTHEPAASPPETAADAPAGLYRRFARGLSLNPDGVALRVGAHTLTYRELDSRARTIAAGIREAGLRSPVRVGILAGKTVDGYASVLAAAFLGAAIVPLNPQFPLSRIETIAVQAEVCVIVADEEGLRTRQGCSEAVRTIPLAFPGAPDEAAATPVRSDEVAYILFTSGTTGTPKGVPITNGSMEHYLDVVQRRYTFTASDVFAQVVELSFDMAMFDLFAAWSCGAGVISVHPKTLTTLSSFLRTHGVTVWFSAPSAISLIRRWDGLQPGSLPTLRVTMFAGEALYVTDALDWQAAVCNAVVDNHYGPTEVNITCSVHRWNSATSPERSVNGMVPIGALYEGLDHVLVDSDGNLTKDRGELCVAGPQTMSGYLDPRNDEGRFLDRDGVRWYRTGDIVRVRPDGEFAFLGRSDDQVQIYGNRIQLSEIEHVLSRCRGVTRAVTIVADGNLTAFYSGEARNAAEFREELADVLPKNLIPIRINHVERFELTINGKIDRAYLVRLLGEPQ